MDEKKNTEVSPIAGNFSKEKNPLIENGVQFNQGDIEDHQSKEYLERRWDKKDGDRSEVIDSEGHRNRINHY
ncbi:hypothetical protein AB1A81_12935 [Bdellovibrio bacteriovorus]|nr:hypothetical protein [Bdellovibrio bacteriovorus]BEV69203.1 hypothetical protein Bb109J_c2623 [Bdellovibrio bacteriovorus]